MGSNNIQKVEINKKKKLDPSYLSFIYNYKLDNYFFSP
jgi:hypothetical protein